MDFNGTCNRDREVAPQDGSVMIRTNGRLLQTAEEAPTIRLGFFTWGISGKSFLPSLSASF